MSDRGGPVSATGKKCYRCQGPVEKHDLNWSFLGSWLPDGQATFDFTEGATA